jgi:hypothetical protein
MSFLSALDEEILSLRESLNNDPRFLKLKELERVRALYARAEDTPSAVTTNGNVTTDSATTQVERRRMSPDRKAAIDESRQFLRGKVEPTKTADLLAHLKANGIKVGGSDPMNNLSALLSTSGIFQANGRLGWTLKKNEAAGTLSESRPTASKSALVSAH